VARRGKSKSIQPGNREWATAIACISGDGFDVPPFLVVQGQYHLASWYSEGGLPHDWSITTSSNGWTDNETGLEWLRHFDKHTKERRKGGYRMLILDGHESHQSALFEEYCKLHNIIPLCLPSHSSHLTQPLDVGLFSWLKRAYGREISTFIRAHITHITKVEFFLAFHAAYKACFNKKTWREVFEVLDLKTVLRGPAPCSLVMSAPPTRLVHRKDSCPQQVIV